MAAKKRAPAKLAKVSVALPFEMGKAEWVPDEAEQRAAWSLYVELVTRIATQDLGLADGLMREAMTSLHSLFETTREILKDAGPQVGARSDSVGGIAIAVLNKGIRPFLAKWHPKLSGHEATRADRAPSEHEADWSEANRFRGELEALQRELRGYATVLSRVCGLPG